MPTKVEAAAAPATGGAQGEHERWRIVEHTLRDQMPTNAILNDNGTSHICDVRHKKTAELIVAEHNAAPDTAAARDRLKAKVAMREALLRNIQHLMAGWAEVLAEFDDGDRTDALGKAVGASRKQIDLSSAQILAALANAAEAAGK